MKESVKIEAKLNPNSGAALDWAKPKTMKW